MRELQQTPLPRDEIKIDFAPGVGDAKRRIYEAEVLNDQVRKRIRDRLGLPRAALVFPLESGPLAAGRQRDGPAVFPGRGRARLFLQLVHHLHVHRRREGHPDGHIAAGTRVPALRDGDIPWRICVWSRIPDPAQVRRRRRREEHLQDRVRTCMDGRWLAHVLGRLLDERVGAGVRFHRSRPQYRLVRLLRPPPDALPPAAPDGEARPAGGRGARSRAGTLQRPRPADPAAGLGDEEDAAANSVKKKGAIK
ncbi:MAG: hypothetical protein BJ554DRAFT_702 [Olpidium bornovanus]|uniref:Uncharacterized protein n=1 Tax=Olpidium bornovanus TaxID=278681 RepID=A0A8H8DHY7_9FUNG|nr:MAG: hypothetical protein BJ554DRAFT_702 [Olpidium bornovanus]